MKYLNIIKLLIIITLAIAIGLLPVEGAEVRSVIHNISEKDVYWDYYTFPGFYYDINNSFGTEKLYFALSYFDPNTMSTAELSDQEDASGYRGAFYTTKARPTQFDFNPWGQYDEIGFLGEDYFVGYNNSDPSDRSAPILYDKSDNRNLMINEQLSKILLDDNNERVFDSSTPLELQEGYELTIKTIDPDGNKIHLELVKDGQVIDSKIVSLSKNNATLGDETYYYKKDLGLTKGIVVLAVHFKDAFKSGGDNAATVDGMFQISDEPITISIGKQFGEMSVRSIDPTDETIILDNKDHPILLSKNRDITLMGDIHIRTANQDNTSAEDPLRYYLSYENESHDYVNPDRLHSSGGASKMSKVVNASEILDAIQRGESVKRDHVRIEGDLNLSKIRLETRQVNRTIYELEDLNLSESAKVVAPFIEITNSMINGTVDFEGAIFESPMDFASTNFTKDVYFRGSQFYRDVKFKKTTFEGNAHFDDSSFDDYANFDDANFNKNASFEYSGFNNFRPTFWKSTFNKNAYFGNSVFNIDVIFDGSKFKGDANFITSTFNDHAYFWNSTFYNSACFNDSDLNIIDFENSTFKGNSYFNGSTFKGEATFWRSNFNKTYFMLSRFYDYAKFEKSKFENGISFSNSAFKGDADFRNTTLGNYSDFNLTRFGSRTDFSDSKFGKVHFDSTNLGGYSIFSRINSSGIDLSKADCDNFYADWDFADPSSKQHPKLKIEMYQKLRENYEKSGLFDDANKCYYVIRKKNFEDYGWFFYYRLFSDKWWSSLDKLPDKLSDELANLSYGYGVKPWNPVIGSLLIIFLFATIFWKLARLRSGFWESAYFSWNTFISGTGKLLVETPTLPKTSTLWIRLVFSLERILGLIFISLLIISFTNTHFLNHI